MMLHPSYVELIDIANKDVQPGEEPVVRSRYSIIHATAKRAHQLVDGAVPLSDGDDMKPLSLAVKEIEEGQVRIEKPESPAIVMGEAMQEAGVLGATDEELIGSTDVTIDQSELVGAPEAETNEDDEQ